jgi:hypothetical protein
LIRRSPRRLLAALALGFVSFAGAACGAIPFEAQPAAGYTHGSGAPLRVALVDAAGGAWSGAIAAGAERYGEAAPLLDLRASPAEANIIIIFHAYSDAVPPALRGYLFQPGVGGFAAVYDVNGEACNYPPARVPVNCNGAIARAEIYLNDDIRAGSDIEARRLRLVLHELGHAFGLTRHSAELDLATLARRYGWN